MVKLIADSVMVQTIVWRTLKARNWHNRFFLKQIASCRLYKGMHIRVSAVRKAWVVIFKKINIKYFPCWYTVISTRVEIGKTRNCVGTCGGVFSHNFEFFQFPRVLSRILMYIKHFFRYISYIRGVTRFARISLIYNIYESMANVPTLAYTHIKPHNLYGNSDRILTKFFKNSLS